MLNWRTLAQQRNLVEAVHFGLALQLLLALLQKLDEVHYLDVVGHHTEASQSGRCFPEVSETYMRITERGCFGMWTIGRKAGWASIFTPAEKNLPSIIKYKYGISKKQLATSLTPYSPHYNFPRSKSGDSQFENISLCEGYLSVIFPWIRFSWGHPRCPSPYVSFCYRRTDTPVPVLRPSCRWGSFVGTDNISKESPFNLLNLYRLVAHQERK